MKKVLFLGYRFLLCIGILFCVCLMGCGESSRLRELITHELTQDPDLTGIHVYSAKFEHVSSNKYKVALTDFLNGEGKELCADVIDHVGAIELEFDKPSAEWLNHAREKGKEERLRREEEERKRKEEERRREEEERKRKEEEKNKKHADYCIAHNLLLGSEAFEEVYTALHYSSETGNRVYDEKQDRMMRAKYRNRWLNLEGTIKEVIDDYDSIRIIFTINNHTISAVFPSMSKYHAESLSVGTKMRFYGRISTRLVLSDIAMDDCVEKH